MTTIGEFFARDIVPDLARRMRDELVKMIRRVAEREQNKDVGKRLHEIANAFQEVKF